MCKTGHGYIKEKMKETHKFENVDIDDLFMQKNLDIIKIIYHTHERTISNIYMLEQQ